MMMMIRKRWPEAAVMSYVIMPENGTCRTMGEFVSITRHSGRQNDEMIRGASWEACVAP